MDIDPEVKKLTQQYKDCCNRLAELVNQTPHTCVGGRWAMCVPYEGNEKLVGTNDEWKGGEK